eukprot:NODE_1348_length_1543_cov_44.587571_g1275_i0.p1 GENE.NODE_1348_length_1543_cov_44.587571_g1275_i0~~NODE_1348_length_1543_cov_44.587571_g1275_i0.p1  ORF type:complete len:491 (-),score=107.37 NODE_1348_length_1543_cov_44.587571_g1275_i0:70-1434(-)
MALLTVTRHFAGQMVQGHRHGAGAYVYPNKYFTYNGQWDQNVKHGKGVFTMGDGTTYEGDFHHGEITGKGCRRWPDGSTYTGEFKDGELHGDGVYLGANGARYEGQHVDNRRHGYGVLTMGGDTYDGNFENHRYHGEGILRTAGGDVFEGHFECGRLHGTATVKYANGDTCQGQFVNGVRHGQASLCHTNGIVYNGDWVDDFPTDAPTKFLLPVITDGRGQLNLHHHTFHASYTHSLSILLICGRTRMIAGLTEEEQRCELERLQQDLSGAGKGKKKSAKPTLEQLRQFEEEMAKPRLKDVPTSSETGRRITLTLWKPPMSEKESRKRPASGKSRTPPEEDLSTDLSPPTLPPGAEKIAFGVFNSENPTVVSKGKTKPKSRRDPKAEEDIPKSVELPCIMCHEATTLNSEAKFENVCFTRGCSEPGAYCMLFEDTTPDCDGARLPALMLNVVIS